MKDLKQIETIYKELRRQSSAELAREGVSSILFNIFYDIEDENLEMTTDELVQRLAPYVKAASTPKRKAA